MSRDPRVQRAYELHAKGESAAARSLLADCLKSRPHDLDTLFAAASVDRATGALDSAAELLSRARKLAPAHPAIVGRLGQVQLARGRRQEGLTLLRAGLKAAGGSIDLALDLAASLFDAGDSQTALDHMRALLAQHPDNASIRVNLAGALVRQHKGEEAVALLAPLAGEHHPRIIKARAEALADAGRLEEAAALHRKLLALQPRVIEHAYNLGVTTMRQGDYDAAIGWFDKVLASDPDHQPALINRGNIAKFLIDMESAVAFYRRAVELGGTLEALAWTNWLFTLNFIELPTEEFVAAHRAFGARYDRPRTRPFARASGEPSALRVGMVSSDFRQHAISYFLLGILENRTKGAWHLTLYSATGQPDAVTDRYAALADAFVPVITLDDDALAERIEQDGIDILVDLSGHTAGSRLPVFGLKPAPVQVSWLGYPHTTGLESMDYLLARIPDTMLALIPETVWEMPITTGYSLPARTDPCRPPPCLRNGHVTFGSFNKLDKITPDVARTWQNILDGVPDSRLKLKSVREADADTIIAMHRQLASFGLDPARLEITPRDEHAVYLTRYHDLDIALDTFPYTGATTTLDTLFMGVPMITLSGETAFSQMSAIFLRAMGLPELVAHNADEYAQRAIALARDPGRLQTLRSEMRPRLMMLPMFDLKMAALSVEATFAQLWRASTATRQGA